MGWLSDILDPAGIFDDSKDSGDKIQDVLMPNPFGFGEGWDSLGDNTLLNPLGIGEGWGASKREKERNTQDEEYARRMDELNSGILQALKDAQAKRRTTPGIFDESLAYLKAKFPGMYDAREKAISDLNNIDLTLSPQKYFSQYEYISPTKLTRDYYDQFSPVSGATLGSPEYYNKFSLIKPSVIDRGYYDRFSPVSGVALGSPEYYSKFGPTSFEQAMQEQYFKNIMPDLEKSISHNLSKSGFAYSPQLAEQIAKARGQVGVDVGKYLSDLGQRRAELGINLAGNQATQAQGREADLTNLGQRWAELGINLAGNQATQALNRESEMTNLGQRRAELAMGADRDTLSQRVAILSQMLGFDPMAAASGYAGGLYADNNAVISDAIREAALKYNIDVNDLIEEVSRTNEEREMRRERANFVGTTMGNMIGDMFSSFGGGGMGSMFGGGGSDSGGGGGGGMGWMGVASAGAKGTGQILGKLLGPAWEGYDVAGVSNPIDMGSILGGYGIGNPYAGGYNSAYGSIASQSPSINPEAAQQAGYSAGSRFGNTMSGWNNLGSDNALSNVMNGWNNLSSSKSTSSTLPDYATNWATNTGFGSYGTNSFGSSNLWGDNSNAPATGLALSNWDNSISQQSSNKGWNQELADYWAGKRGRKTGSVQFAY